MTLVPLSPSAAALPSALPPAVRTLARNPGGIPSAPGSLKAADRLDDPDAEGDRADSPDSALYLRVAQEAVRVDGPTALAQWWRGALQRMLPQRALLVVPLYGSAPAGLPQWLGEGPWRGEAAACALAAPLATAWAEAGHRPVHLEAQALPRAEGLRAESCWVHGLRGRRLFAFFGVPPALGEMALTQALALLVPLLDAALRGAGESAAVPAGTGGGARWPSAGSAPITMRRPLAGALSERERQIMAWVAQGKTNPEIGCILRISEFTVKNHLKSIFSKLDVTNRAQAVARMSRLALHA